MHQFERAAAGCLVRSGIVQYCAAGSDDDERLAAVGVNYSAVVVQLHTTAADGAGAADGVALIVEDRIARDDVVAVVRKRELAGAVHVDLAGRVVGGIEQQRRHRAARLERDRAGIDDFHRPGDGGAANLEDGVVADRYGAGIGIAGRAVECDEGAEGDSKRRFRGAGEAIDRGAECGGDRVGAGCRQVRDIDRTGILKTRPVIRVEETAADAVLCPVNRRCHGRLSRSPAG
jgi:hypothetical protein